MDQESLMNFYFQPTAPKKRGLFLYVIFSKVRMKVEFKKQKG